LLFLRSCYQIAMPFAVIFLRLAIASERSYRVYWARTVMRVIQDRRRAWTTCDARRAWNNIHCLPMETIRNNIAVLTYISRRDGRHDCRTRRSKANSDETAFLTCFLTSRRTSRWTRFASWQPPNMVDDLQSNVEVATRVLYIDCCATKFSIYLHPVLKNSIRALKKYQASNLKIPSKVHSSP